MALDKTRMVVSGRWYGMWGERWLVPGAFPDEPIIYPRLPPTVTLHLATRFPVRDLSEKANGLSRSSDRFWRRHKGAAGTIEAGRKLISRVEE